MDYLASFTLLPLRLAGNQLIENVASPDGITDRAPLLYRLDIYKPEAYQSGTFVVHESLRGREAPTYVAGGITFSEGCNFDLSEFVWSLLSASPPRADQNTISIQPLATMPYYVKSWVSPYQTSTDLDSGIQYLIRAKLNEEQFSVWKENFFTIYLQEKRGFLSWQPNINKVVDRNQPEFLSLLLHHNPAPTALKVRVDVEYSDGSRSPTTLTLNELLTVQNYSLYTIPVGFEALELDELEAEEEKEILAYTVWVSDQNTQQLTEERRYIVNNDYQPYVRHLVFLNSLGGWDTLRLFGVSSEQLQTNPTTFQRQLEANYTPSSEEIFVTNIIGERRLTLNTGYLPDRTWLQYLEELFWAESIYINTMDGLVPLILAQNTYDSPNDEENFGGRTLSFKRSKIGKSYSALPSASIINNAARPTQWVGLGSGCLVNENGVRTGVKSYSMLELRYTDGISERVAGVSRKKNLPDTDGYIPPFSSSDCSSTPYLNTEITRLGTYTKNGCGSGFVGKPATITINAAAYGSELSQAQAQARAEVAWNALNTQEYANLFGSCEPNFSSAAISRQSTYLYGLGCTLPSIGGPWTIVVSAGAHSASSQAAADALATNAANLLDTQSNANLYGSCVGGQNYSLTPPSGKANYRVFIRAGLAANTNGFQSKSPTQGLTRGINNNIVVTAPGTGIALLHDSQSQGTVPYQYQIYKNAQLLSSGSDTIPNTQGFQVFLNLPTCAAGDLFFIYLF